MGPRSFISQPLKGQTKEISIPFIYVSLDTMNAYKVENILNKDKINNFWMKRAMCD